MEKKSVFLFIVLIILISSFLVSASFIKGDKLYEIKTDYGFGDKLQGWFNISFEDEPSDSLLEGFDYKMKLLDFLILSGLNPYSDFTCLPVDCESGYSTNGNGQGSMTFTLQPLQKKLIGFRIDGNVTHVNEFKFDVSSSAGEACYDPLKIDILNDGDIEWRAYHGADDYICRLDNYMGCYQDVHSSGNVVIGRDKYCERITLPVSNSFEVGAAITPGTTLGVVFKIEVYDEDFDIMDGCTASQNSNLLKCIVDFENREQKEYYVCLNADKQTDYEIDRETVDPCGFVFEYGNEEFNGFTVDYPIYAIGEAFSPIGSFTLDDDEVESVLGESQSLSNYVEDFIYDKYDGDCESGCVIPVEFKAGAEQQITVSNIRVGSLVSGQGTVISSNVFNIEEDEAKINMDFRKLLLQNSNISVPEQFGDLKLRLTLGGDLIFEEDIEIARVPVISWVSPTSLPAGMPIKFRANVQGGNISEYLWEFGDNTAKVETMINTTQHMYNSTGSYQMKLTAKNEIGNSTKQFTIRVVSPKEFINGSITEKQRNLRNISIELSKLPLWIQQASKKYISVEDLNASLSVIKEQNRLAVTESDYTRIMLQLTQLKIPKTIRISNSGSGIFFMNKSIINLDKLEEAGAGEYYNDTEAYKEGMMAWVLKEITSQAEFKVYAGEYEEGNEDLFSYLKFSITPKNFTVSEMYLIIDEEFNLVGFKEDYGQKIISLGNAVGISKYDLINKTEIEFILPEKVGLYDIPIYMTTSFSKLSIGVGPPDVCNGNKVCEKTRGEDSKNCKSDCKPWGRIILYIVLLLFAGFWGYIGLQEWYKRYYENHLFKNKTDLFNLINFMNNAINQGLEKGYILRSLEKLRWKREQIIYAFNKFKGKRTGMWEIPLFKWVENKKVKEEISKRQNAERMRREVKGGEARRRSFRY